MLATVGLTVGIDSDVGTDFNVGIGCDETAVDLLEDGHLDVVVHLQGEEVLQET
jgi:hypothetical protein